MRPIKSPERCPHCNSVRLIKKGMRKKKFETVQLYRCLSCGRVFTPGAHALRNKTYPQREILDAITTYNLGYSLSDTAKRMATRYGHKVSGATLSRWIHLYPTLTSYARIRSDGRKLFKPVQTIRAVKLYHQQVYDFAYHRPKLVLLREGKLGGKHNGDARFAGIADFLELIPKQCPHELFRKEDGRRGSQLDAGFISMKRLLVTQKQNVATETAALVLPTVGSNYDRHPKLQRFMLANDSATLAIEVPIWLSEADIAALERQYGIELGAHTDNPRSITGHIDFLQVRHGAIHILDYKPDARTNKPIAQLTMYALALTRLIPGLKLFDIKCAWFNEVEYCEFFPRTALAHSRFYIV